MTTFTYKGFRFKQRADGSGPAFFLFHAPVSQVSAWADVERLSPGARKNVQREPVKSRISSIKRFYEKDRENTIPTAIVVALRGTRVDKVDDETSVLTVEVADAAQKPGLIIDGQHRLRGMHGFNGATRVAIVAILEPDHLEMAFQFLVINNKAAKVPRDHLRALALNYPEDVLKVRLESARLSLDENVGSVGVLDEDDESPFRGMIAWPNNDHAERVVTPSAIEVMAGYAKSLGVKELEEPDGLNAFLMAMWRKIKAEWSDVFNADTHLLEKVGLICLTQFIGDTLKSWSLNPRLEVKFGDPDNIEENVGYVIECLERSFFKAKWASTSYDTRAGRDQIMTALATMSRNITNREPWYHDVHVLDRTWVEEHQAGTSSGG